MPKKRTWNPRKKPTKETEEDLHDHWEWVDGIPDRTDGTSSTNPTIHTAGRSPEGQVFRSGDIVQIQGDTTTLWVALIRHFETVYSDEDNEQQALIIWFCRQADVKKQKRRKGATAVPPN
jgi:hypothetical protein